MSKLELGRYMEYISLAGEGGGKGKEFQELRRVCARQNCAPLLAIPRSSGNTTDKNKLGLEILKITLSRWGYDPGGRVLA